ncbi:hypothetical protein H2198_007371 [Neophaeococcomyces mojaviensis]|uniref:Uncharacterized protein n=1 Tax=Neophaeococcomyces mojaviensis TaxID=3383035 RepID=A0ACC3A0D4_9EURO|nr:hypothetical protein H2198_007371 [Knufia sp. JES_112]
MTDQSSDVPINAMKYIYKIAPSSPLPMTRLADLDPATLSEPVLPPSDLDGSSSFIHMSTAAQISGTLKHFFPTSFNERNIVYILRVLLPPLEDAKVVRWESPDAKICGSREGEGMFPHLYFDEPAKGSEPSGTGQGRNRRLWLKNSEVQDTAEVVSEAGSVGWEEGLRKLDGWLI